MGHLQSLEMGELIITSLSSGTQVSNLDLPEPYDYTLSALLLTNLV